MTPPLFLVAELPAGDRAVLDGPEGRHAARVKRLGPGEALLLGDGLGTVLDCRVTAVQGDRLELEVTSRRAVPRPTPRLVVAQALPKSDRAELAIELLTELGVDEILPWRAARSIGQWKDGRTDAKWLRTAQEAAKQSRRAWVPDVSGPVATPQLAARADGALVLHEDATEPISTVTLPPGDRILLVVGPEGGIDAGELAALSTAGARTVRLGEPVLRTSTAGAAALAALAMRLGRW